MMESFYPIFAVFAAIAALAIGAGELIFLEIKPAAILTWLFGWMLSMSLIFNSSWQLIWAMIIAVALSVFYAFSVLRLMQSKKSKEEPPTS
jgi:hypothetical protein